MALDRDLDLLLALGRVHQVCPDCIRSGHRRLEWVLGVLDVRGEEIGPGIAVERLPRPPVALEEVARGSVTDRAGYPVSSSRRSNPVAIR